MANIGQKVSFNFTSRKGVKYAGTGKVTGVAHVRFDIYNVVVDDPKRPFDHVSISVAGKNLHEV